MSNETNIPAGPDMSDEELSAQLGFLGKQFALAESSYKNIAKCLTKCQTLAQTCLALEKENPAALQPTYNLLLQAIEDLKAAILAPPTDPSQCILPPFATDDLPKLNRQLDEYIYNHTSTQNILHLAYEAFNRAPQIIVTVLTMANNGISIDDLITETMLTFNSIMAQFPQVLDANPGYKIYPNPEIVARGMCALHAIRIVVEKAEAWVHAKARTLSPVPKIITVFHDQIKDLGDRLEKGAKEGGKEGAKEGVQKVIAENRKKQRGPLRKSGAGKKPTFDILDLQCKEFWELYLANPSKDPHDYARKILNDPKWHNPEFKKDNPYLYTPNMTEEDKRTVRKNLIKRFITWCKTNNKGDPFPKNNLPRTK